MSNGNLSAQLFQSPSNRLSTSRHICATLYPRTRLVLIRILYGKVLIRYTLYLVFIDTGLLCAKYKVLTDIWA